MTELQAKELEMLKEFIRICEELNLKYYLVCGTALGSVKYNGFIPWDDDVDVALPREDYEVFIEKAQKMLPRHLFLQNYKTDPMFPQIYSKLRNSDTTYIEKSVSHLKMNHGIYIDIFPLDGYPDDKDEQNVLENRKKLYKRKLYCVYRLKRSIKDQIVWCLGHLLGYHKKTVEIIKQYTDDISCYPTASSSVWCNHGNWQGKLEYAPKEQYGDGILVSFEGLCVRIPEKFDEYLTQKYGDWRADLPEAEKVGHHYYLVMDTDKPYNEYMQ